MRKAKGDYAILTVTNALRLLEEFRNEVEIGVAELGRRLRLHKNNVFRLLATLEEAGYIEQNVATGRYRLGLAALQLGQAFSRSRPLLTRGPTYLEELAGSTAESAHLAMLDGFDVVHVAGIAPSRMVVSSLRVGQRLPLHCTALGKVLLAYGPDTERESFDKEVVASRGLEARTRRTIQDPTKFFEHVRMVAGQGFALDLEECEDGLCCAAAPVHDVTGRVVAALSVSAPASRADERSLLEEILPRVSGAAERLSRELGHHV
ncbi:MAG TPA: IclR family transcriptional regulator [Myxococcota bacterium]|nr:IclR family transcriptional regulator [Myxococcota bacterium]